MGLVAVPLMIAGCTSGSSDPAGQRVCDSFRQLTAGAFGESLTAGQVEAGLRDLARDAEDSSTPAVRDNAMAVSSEARVDSLFSGEPDAAQDGLADACNTAFPLNR